MFKTFTAALFVAATVAQQIGHQAANKNLAMTYETCTKAGGCSKKTGAVTVDANWRWVHGVGGYQNCYKGNTWDP